MVAAAAAALKRAGGATVASIHHHSRLLLARTLLPLPARSPATPAYPANRRRASTMQQFRSCEKCSNSTSSSVRPPRSPGRGSADMPRAATSSPAAAASSTGLGSNSADTALSRLRLLSSHLQPQQFSQRPANNFPFSTLPPQHSGAAMTSQQPKHPRVLIPGPVEYDDAVLQAMAHFSQSHVSQPFVNTFGEVLAMVRRLMQTTNPKSQPFVLSGSGTLGWDQVAANLCEPGDNALVLHTGYFGDSFSECFETYGTHATQIKAPIGDRPQLPEIEKALGEKKYKVVTVTHVDTSTGVLSEVEPLIKLVRRVSPDTLVVVDGVCSVGAEEIRFDDWDIDVVLTASQKAIGCPAGLSILMASERAMGAFNARKTPPGTYFASWKRWTPIMQNYEAKKPSYFATPSPQLVNALHVALTQLLSEPLDDRFAKQREVSNKVKEQVAALGLKQLAAKPENQSVAMTAIYLPDGVTAPEFLPGLLERGVVFAGGLHKDIATKYVRFGHMGVSAMKVERDDIDYALKALADRIAEVKAAKQ